MQYQPFTATVNTKISSISSIFNSGEKHYTNQIIISEEVHFSFWRQTSYWQIWPSRVTKSGINFYVCHFLKPSFTSVFSFGLWHGYKVDGPQIQAVVRKLLCVQAVACLTTSNVSNLSVVYWVASRRFSRLYPHVHTTKSFIHQSCFIFRHWHSCSEMWKMKCDSDMITYLSIILYLSVHFVYNLSPNCSCMNDWVIVHRHYSGF